MSLKLNERYPGRMNNPSADYPQGSFKNRTTPVAKDGSYLEQDWVNDKEGFFQSLLSAAGFAANGSVDKVGASQTYDAMRALDQLQSGVYFATSGTSTAQILTPTPELSAYAAGVRYSVMFNVTSGVSPTINVSGRGAKNAKQYNSSGVKVAAAWVAGQISDIVYDGTDFILVDQLPSGSQAASEAVSGVARIGTQAEVDAGVLNTVIVTPKKIRFGFAWSFGVNGYIVFPTWLQGFILQWGLLNAGASSVSFPIAFPAQALGISLTPNNNIGSASADGHYFGTLSATAFTRGTTYTNSMRYLVWGN